MRARFFALVAALLVAATTPAFAESKHHHVSLTETTDPRPGPWCAWWLRRHLGIPKSAFRPWEWNLAWAFRYIGTPADGPCRGCIAVWRHHVGVIDGECEGNNCIVLSGNDGGEVRRRMRSVKGAKFRHPPGSFLALGGAP